MELHILGPKSFRMIPENDADNALLELWNYKYVDAIITRANLDIARGIKFLNFDFVDIEDDEPETTTNEGERNT